MVLGANVKRACIYFIYDKDGVVDRYILEQLKDLRRNVQFLHCVINGKLMPESEGALQEIADEVYIRENTGMDAGAYKDAIRHIGWETLSQYDELVLMNFTCFGPVYPFREVFDWAKDQDVEIWGLTLDRKTNLLGTNKHLHFNKSDLSIQSYFIALRAPLFGSEHLSAFFDEIPDDINYMQSGAYFEHSFPGYFEEMGYKSAVYCDTDDSDYPLLHDPVSLLKEYRMPLFKKRSFFHHYTDVLTHTAGEATARLLDYLKTETDYDTDLIWESVLRTGSLSDIVRCAQLNRVLPANHRTAPAGVLHTAVVFHAYYEDLFDDSISYVKNAAGLADLLMTTDTEKKAATLCKLLKDAGVEAKVQVVRNRGRDVSALLVGAAEYILQYDLVCFAHDKKSPQMSLPGVGRSWAYKLHENTLGTREYIENVVDLFSREQHLGISFPSMPNHDQYGYQLGSGWTGNFENTKKLLADFGITVKMHPHTLCVAPLGTCFWFRPQALEKLLQGYEGDGWHYEDFPCEPNRYDQTILHAVERSYAYFAQASGYYPAYLYSDRYAAIELTNLEYLKTGSADMRAWTNALALEAVGYLQPGETNRLTDQEIVARYSPEVNYGVRQSLVHLAYALRCKYPKMWATLLPLRRLGQKILRIKTK